MGATIVGGALTSCFSGIVLLFCQADILSKFGVLLLITIVSSMTTALIFLPSWVYLIGPEAESGQVNFDCFKKKKEVSSF